MKSTNYSQQGSSKTRWVSLAYCILSFYQLGVLMMVHFCNYPAFGNIQEHIQPVMDIVYHRMIIVCFIPSILLLIISLLLYKYSSKMLQRTTGIAIALSLVSVVITLFLVAPVYSALPVTGFTQTLQQKLLMLSLFGQILPAVIQVGLSFTILNIFFKTTKVFSRMLFILLFALTFYTAGADFVDKWINYPSWAFIGAKDWGSYRHAADTFLFRVYLLPAYLPLLLVIPLFWWRPMGIPKGLVLTFLLMQLWILGITGGYFLPKIQIPLSTHGYSLTIIQQLLHNEFALRGIATWIILVVTAAMFIKSATIPKSAAVL